MPLDKAGMIVLQFRPKPHQEKKEEGLTKPELGLILLEMRGPKYPTSNQQQFVPSNAREKATDIAM